MEISNKSIIFIAMSFILFLYLSDTLKQPKFQEKVKDLFNRTMGNSSSHSVLHWLDTRTNSLAGLISVSSMTILNALPVIFDVNFFYLIFK